MHSAPARWPCGCRSEPDACQFSGSSSSRARSSRDWRHASAWPLRSAPSPRSGPLFRGFEAATSGSWSTSRLTIGCSCLPLPPVCSRRSVWVFSPPGASSVVPPLRARLVGIERRFPTSRPLAAAGTGSGAGGSCGHAADDRRALREGNGKGARFPPSCSIPPRSRLPGSTCACTAITRQGGCSSTVRSLLHVRFPEWNTRRSATASRSEITRRRSPPISARRKRSSGPTVRSATSQA